MTCQKQLHKDRAAYCSQCYDNIRLRCPFCLLEKIPRHCKIYKNAAALWWHIRQQHNNSATSNFDMNAVLDALNGVTRAMQWGIIVN
ncbi:MAG: hypothetical protein OEQ94_00780 [Nitrosopumilus sp.]|nr:hypothetical protein [Nitrosopumilus sp.]MDH3822275.1 hypothetical protein [Nitrosopumilus sp.]MDH3833076.1 hypothetical protein [Nitrosopumilus sp.]